MPAVLVVEDDPETLEMLCEVLREAGHVVEAATDLASARRSTATTDHGLIVLDWMLPDGDGISLCRELRQSGRQTPVLMLTARGDVSDRVTGLEAGADDYLQKPFAVAELIARVNALLRRGLQQESPAIRLGAAEVDLSRRLVTIDGGEVSLTATEFSLLRLMLTNRGRALSRSEILRSIWDEETPGAEASLEVLISRLRRKLSTPDIPFPIRTHRGYGYSLSAEG